MAEEKDLNAMPMNELEALVLQEFSRVGNEAQPVEQPRDEQGRFAKAESEQQEEDAVEEVAEIVYRREIDLGDGSGVQVFEADSPEGLIDKLAEAQKHATRKIREQAQALKQREAQPAPKKEDQQTEVDKFLRQQQWLADPDSLAEAKARELYQKEIAPKLEKIERMEREQRDTATAQTWVESHSDYYAVPQNGAKMTRWLELNGLEVTPENLDQAFEDLNADGLLVGRPKETGATETEGTQETRIEQPKVTTTTRRKVVGGLSTKRSAPVEQRSPEPTEDELRKLPLEELERGLGQWLRG